MLDSPVTEAAPHFRMPLEKGRWVLVASGLIINLLLGSVYALSVFVEPLTEYYTRDLGQAVTANDILMPFSVVLAVFAITMPFTGKIINRHGPRNVTIIGGLVAGLGWFLVSFS